jgi:hypothetical protein
MCEPRGRPLIIRLAALQWEKAHGTAFQIRTSNDAVT